VRSPLLAFGALATLVASLVLPACGSSSKGSASGGAATDAGDAAPIEASSHEAAAEASDEAGDDDGGSDAGIPGYPAFAPAMAQIYDSKGPVLSTPRIVTVTWASDTNAATYQAFDDAIGTSDFWKPVTEYGVGPATSVAADHVVVTTDPTSPWDASAIDQWTKQMIAAAPGNGWPTPDAQTVYIVYVPANVSVTDQGQDACNIEGGYHTSLSNSSLKNGVAYALVLQSCGPEFGLDTVSNATITASHELIEATTDPHPGFAPAWTGFDTASLGWELWNDWQDEVADACEDFIAEYSYVDTGSFPYTLSRFWSNASAKAGHSPCVPAPAGAYNNVTPLGLESINVYANSPFGASPYTTQGWHISPGQTATVSVGFYSDAPTGSWGVQAYEGDCCENTTSYLTVTPASFSGQNGDTQQLSITVNSAPPAGTNAILLTFWSAHAKYNRYMPVVIGAY
jgi:hypothetical protein